MVDGHLNFDVVTNTKGFNKDIGNINKSFGGLKSGLSKLGGVLETVFSVKVIKDFADECKSLYDVQLEAEARLEQVMRNTMDATDEQIQSVKDYSSALQELGVIGDEVQLSGLQELGTYVENADSLKKMNVVLNDMLAQQYGLNATSESAVTIATMLGKVLEGQTSALSRYGYSFDEAQEQLLKYGTEEQRVATLAEVVEQSVGGMNEALANTSAGRMKQLENTAADIKEQFGKAVYQVEVLFLPALQRLANWLAKVASMAESVASALARVFGNQAAAGNSTAQTADAASEAAESYSDMADSAEKAAEANEDSLASFDKINKLGTGKSDSSSAASSTDSDTSSGGGISGDITITPTVDTSGVDKKLEDLFRKIKSTAGTLLDPFKKAWETKGEGVISSLNNAFEGMKGLASAVGSSFWEVWTNGTGQETIEHILGIFEGMNNFVGNIAKSLTNAWTEDGLGTSVIQHAADILNIILGHTEDISKSWADWAADVDFKPLLKALDDLEIALAPFVDNVGEGLLWFHENVLQPLASWVIEDAVPAFLDSLADAIEGLNAAWETAAPVLEERLWEGFLKPIAQWAGETAVELIRDLGKGIKKLGESITEKDVNALIDLAEGIAGIIAVCKGKKHITTFVESIKGMGGKVGSAWTMATTPIGEAGGASLGTAIFAGLLAAIGGWAIGSAIYDKLGDEIDEVLEPVFDKITGAWDILKGGINEYIEGSSDNLLAMTTAFTDFGSAVKGTFEEAADAVSNGMLKVSDFVTAVKGGFGEAAEAVSEGLMKVTGFFSDMWENIKETLSDWGKWFAARWKDVTTAFSNTGKWFKDKFTAAWKNITAAFSNLGTWFADRWKDISNAFATVGSWFKDKFTSAWDNIKNAFSNIGTWFSNRWSDVKKVFSNVGSWFKDKFTSAWDNIKKAFTNTKNWFSKLWENIKAPFATVATWFHDTFSKAWQKVKDVFSTGGQIFSGIVDGISDVFKDTVNTIIDGLNYAIAAPFNAINNTITWVRELGIAGVTPFENLEYISVPQIPKLATGTVVPANYGEFLAILGDNKRETEVVSPLSTIEQAVTRAIAKAGGFGGSDKTPVFYLILDGDQLNYKLEKRSIAKAKRTGGV